MGLTRSNKQLGMVKLLRSAGDDLGLLMCFSVHEHAWMSAGLGVWGREEYLKRFWSVVDWRKVSDVYRLWYTKGAVFRNAKERWTRRGEGNSAMAILLRLESRG